MKKIRNVFATGCVLATVLTSGAVGARAQDYTNGAALPSPKITLSTIKASIPKTATIYYVSPKGSDSNPGTKRAPFKSLMKAQSVASSGDIVLIRGNAGDYNITDADVAKSDDIYHYVNDFTKSGITYEAYPGDPRPVFDFSQVTTDRRVAAFFIDPSAKDLTFKGFDVTGTKAGNQKQSENFNIRGNAFIENVIVHDSEANGFYFNVHGSGTVINSDAFNNLGPTAANAGNTDGFGGHGDNIAFINDRSWHNSDDGFDSINSWGHVIYDHDWSFDNRGNKDGIGDQNGFKIGGYAYEVNTPTRKYIPDQLPVHSVEYSLSVNNGANGFYANHMPGQSANWTNNTAYANSNSQFDMLERVSPTDINNIAGYREVLHNNIAFKGLLTKDDNTPAENETNNSWTINGGLQLTDNDFKSLDESQLSAPRKSDGSLPDVTFMQPLASSPLSQYGLGYLADKNDPTVSLQKLVSVYGQYGNIDNAGIENSLNMKLQNHDLQAFINELAAQSGKHIDKDTARVLTIEANAIIDQE